MKKLFLVLFLLLSGIFMTSCSGVNTAERRLEDEGFVLKSADQEETDEFIEAYDIEGFKNIHYIYNDSDSIIPIGILVEYKSKNALEEALNFEDLEEEPDNVYRHLLIIDLSIQHDLVEIIKG